MFHVLVRHHFDVELDLRLQLRPDCVDLVAGPEPQLKLAQPGWTLDQVAEAAGVSRRLVVNIEQGATNPSVGTLLRISDALGVGLPALVEPRACLGGEGHPSR